MSNPCKTGSMSLPVIFLDDFTIGGRVRILRTIRGLRQRELAELAQCTQPEVSALECGRYTPPSVERRILEALEPLE